MYAHLQIIIIIIIIIITSIPDPRSRQREYYSIQPHQPTQTNGAAPTRTTHNNSTLYFVSFTTVPAGPKSLASAPSKLHIGIPYPR
ncbi:hypothetical protein BJ508DRAFT_47262 [Ascobolus immersus RN42]|uniref:Uncharacterized protein n=1 Tax=Ascobolus immersus RN42 TaxID=1160509 RepID=A0A3N4IF07_ASCIM|nr:hypothetical protein BJ508DRAFT_47262 [Ascobolus immersus RN42]